MSASRFAFAAVVALLSTALGAASCAKSGPVTTMSTGTGGSHASTGSMSGPLPTSICLLHNCDTDVECAACSDGKTTCLASEHRCVACSAGGSTGCPSGQKCSSYGNCVGSSLDCPTDNGVPTITCNTTADCGACDPAHQVCDPAAHKCVACTAADVTQCQSTETCSGGDCAPKCPADCTSDGDCGECGAPGHEAHACFQHKCSECSPTKDCNGVMSCGAHGTCAATCGKSGAPKGECETDADCTGCDGSATKCNGVPIGGGAGTCGPSAPGCSELGMGLVLPAPFDKVTNLCSMDMDCASIGIDLNVGKMMRDLTGWDQIHDADITYPEHVCASVEITGGKSCGVCVPCKVDTDCQNISVDMFAAQAFGPLGKIAAAFLLDQIFGAGDHEIHMYCETVSSGYGVCVPCPGLLNDCSVGTVTGNGMCDPANSHDKCSQGLFIDPDCDTCAAKVCVDDSYCCTVAWDKLCVDEVGDACGAPCETCAHDKCSVGAALDPTCSPCVDSFCGFAGSTYEYCCTAGGMWDQACIDAIPQYCTKPYWCDMQCNNATDCPAGQGCVLDTFTCGACTIASECRSGEICTMGTCGSM
jgi:hypothetical protein